MLLHPPIPTPACFFHIDLMQTSTWANSAWWTSRRDVQKLQDHRERSIPLNPCFEIFRSLCIMLKNTEFYLPCLLLLYVRKCGENKVFFQLKISVHSQVWDSSVAGGEVPSSLADCRQYVTVPAPCEILAKNSRTNAGKSLSFFKEGPVYNWLLLHCAAETLPKKPKTGKILKNTLKTQLNIFNVLSVIFLSAWDYCSKRNYVSHFCSQKWDEIFIFACFTLGG